jgi:aryl-alcohol dehydrogenase-like predicted oxidoreductase
MNARFILGTVQFGLRYGINNNYGKPSKEDVFDILNFAHDQGITQLDTASSYGDAQRLICEFIKDTQKQFLINTKFHLDHDINIKEQLNLTLRELGVQKIHVYFFHRFNDLKTKPDALPVLQELKEDGKINNIGASVYTNDELKYCIDREEIDVIQLPFNQEAFRPFPAQIH